MDLLTLIGIALALAMDAFATAAAVVAGLRRPTYRHTFRLSWHFGLFQAGMPVLGWLGGTALTSLTRLFTRVVATCLLGMIGLKMIWDAGRSEKKFDRYDPTRGWSLVALSLATSIDALAVGISIGLMGDSIWVPAGVIGVITMVVTYVGVRIGKKAENLMGPWAERLGGAVLIAIGIRISFFS